jgi:hypothetical protein
VSPATAGIWYLTEREIDDVCASSYPCTRDVAVELTSGSAIIDSLLASVLLLVRAGQAGPQAFGAGGGAPCAGELRTAVTAIGAPSLAIDLAVAAGATFGVPGSLQRVELAGVCGGAAAQITSKALSASAATEMSSSHAPAAGACSHAVAVFGTAD